MLKTLGKLFQRVECDCSPPIINAAVEEFNGTKLKVYLQMVHSVLNSES